MKKKIEWYIWGGVIINTQIKNLYQEFIKIKERGWIKSLFSGNNGVGLTLESLLGISKNELEIPDYNGIEIKSKRIKSKSYIIMFSIKPQGKYYHESKRIKDEFGYPHRIFKQYNVLNNSVYCNFKTKIGINFYFQLEINREKEKIYLKVYDLKGNLIEKDVYWDFDDIKEKLYRKLTFLALFKADSKKIEKCEYFKYVSLTFYKLKDFNTFLNLLEIGIIRLNFKLNIKTKGDKIGQIHDHGTSFDILEKDIPKLYDEYFVLNEWCENYTLAFYEFGLGTKKRT